MAGIRTDTGLKQHKDVDFMHSGTQKQGAAQRCVRLQGSAN